MEKGIKVKSYGMDLVMYASGAEVLMKKVKHPTEGLIIIPDTVRDKQQFPMFQVTAVGPFAIEQSGIDIRVDDYVQFVHSPHENKHGLAKLPIDDGEVWCVEARSIVTVLKKEEMKGN